MSSSQARHVEWVWHDCSNGRWAMIEDMVKLEGRVVTKIRRILSPTVQLRIPVDAQAASQRRPIYLKENHVFSFPWSSEMFLLHTESEVVRVELRWQSSIHSASLTYREARKLWRKGCKKECKDRTTDIAPSMSEEPAIIGHGDLLKLSEQGRNCDCGTLGSSGQRGWKQFGGGKPKPEG